MFSRVYRTVSQYIKFIRDYYNFINLDKYKRFPISLRDLYPCLRDNTGKTIFDRHYIYHTAWAARILRKVGPNTHIDISSSLYFSAIASAFINLEYYDYRPPDLRLDNLKVGRVNLLKLPFQDNSILSISVMHVIEHLGLGRYGDPIDPDGDLKAISELMRVVAPGGSLLFVVPIGRSKIMFNAHRIYSYEQIIQYFYGFILEEYSLIPENPDDGGLIRNPDKELTHRQIYGCGCFWFKNNNNIKIE